MKLLLVPIGFLPGGSEWIIILLVVLLLFGAKRLPELARSLGKGMSEFRKAMNEATSEFNKVKDEVQSAADDTPAPKQINAATQQSNVPPTDGGSPKP
jgi:sec-independent protein translocase protein TatA